MFRLTSTVLIILALSLAGFAAIPLEVNHQGLVSVNGEPFSGTGYFRFALVDPDSGNNLWTNDGTQVGTGNTPTTPLQLLVVNGIYDVRLGDTDVMAAISSNIFHDDNVVLRIWFNDGVNGLRQLTPDHVLTASPYTFHALNADMATSATSAINADTVDGAHAAELEESAEIDADITTHNNDPSAHPNLQALASNTGRLFKNFVELLSSKQDWENMIFDFDFASDTAVTKTNIEYATSKQVYFGPSQLVDEMDMITIDECDDSIINDYIWTFVNDNNAEAQEHSDYLEIRARTVADPYSAGYVITDFDIFETSRHGASDDYGYAIVRFNLQNDAGAQRESHAQLEITGGADAGLHDILVNSTNGNMQYMDDVVMFAVRTPNSVHVYESHGPSWHSFAVGSSHRFRFYVYTVPSGVGTDYVRIQVQWYRFWDFSSPTVMVFETEHHTTDNEVLDVIPVINIRSETGTVLLQATADGGTHFEDVMESKIHSFANTGTSLGLRTTISDYTGGLEIVNYGMLYNNNAY